MAYLVLNPLDIGKKNLVVHEAENADSPCGTMAVRSHWIGPWKRWRALYTLFH